MKIKLASQMAQHGQDALSLHAHNLYASLGSNRVVIAELAAIERTQIAATEDKEATVTLQIKNLEVAGEGQEDAVRQAMRALYTQRTAAGTITADDDIEVSERTLDACAGELNAIEAARLHVAIEKWADRARNAQANSKLNAVDVRRELKAVADGLMTVIYPGWMPIAPE